MGFLSNKIWVRIFLSHHVYDFFRNVLRGILFSFVFELVIYRHRIDNFCNNAICILNFANSCRFSPGRHFCRFCFQKVYFHLFMVYRVGQPPLIAIN